VVAVLTTEFASFSQAKRAIGQIGRAVYQYDAGERLTLPQAKRATKAPPAKTKSSRKSRQRRG
jgi:hypothetical protein